MNGKELYTHLIPIYSSPHDDTKQEMIESISMLDAAIANGYTPQFIIKKMKQKAKQPIDYKSKLYTSILNQFWTKNYNSGVAFRSFNEEDI